MTFLSYFKYDIIYYKGGVIVANYVLMNKNTPVQDFFTRYDEFGDIEVVAGKQYTHKVPLGFVNLH